MKKIVIVLCVALMGVLCLSACGSKKQEEQTQAETQMPTVAPEVASVTAINLQDTASLSSMAPDFKLVADLATTTIMSGSPVCYDGGSEAGVAISSEGLGQITRVIDTVITDSQAAITISLNYGIFNEQTGDYDYKEIKRINNPELGSELSTVSHELSIGKGLSLKKVTMTDVLGEKEITPIPDGGLIGNPGQYIYDSVSGVLYVYPLNYPVTITLEY